MARKIIAGNWKMNLNLDEGLELIEQIAGFCEEEKFGNVEVVVSPSYVFLPLATRISNGKNLSIAAQNCSEYESGAYTGEVSLDMLNSIDVEAVIIGHSERRQYYNDTDETINAKALRALRVGLTPIICVGEQLEDRKNSRQEEIVEKQLRGALKNIGDSDMLKLVIAYEPVWAIGTGETASPQQAQDMHFFIREFLRKNYNSEIAESISLLYGGSVKPENAKEIFDQADVDGGLIGGASLKFEQFSKLIQIGEEVL